MTLELRTLHLDTSMEYITTIVNDVMTATRVDSYILVWREIYAAAVAAEAVSFTRSSGFCCYCCCCCCCCHRNGPFTLLMMLLLLKQNHFRHLHAPPSLFLCVCGLAHDTVLHSYLEILLLGNVPLRSGCSVLFKNQQLRGKPWWAPAITCARNVIQTISNTISLS